MVKPVNLRTPDTKVKAGARIHNHICFCHGSRVARRASPSRMIGVIFAFWPVALCLEPTIRAGDRRAMALVSERLRIMKQEEMREDWNTLFCASFLIPYFELARSIRRDDARDKHAQEWAGCGG